MFFNELSKEINNLDELSIFIIVLILFLIVVFSKNKIKTIIILLIFISLMIIIICDKFNTNACIGEKADLIETYKTLNTGDFVLYRSYRNDSLLEITAIKIFLPLMSKIFFTHLGIIYKDTDGKIYVLEANSDYYFCCLDQKYKRGPAVLDFYDRITNIDAYRVHVVRTNIHKFIDTNKFIESIYKFKDYNFSFLNGKKNIYCVSYISKLLEDIGLLKNNKYLIIPTDALNKKNYTFNIEYDNILMIKDN